MITISTLTIIYLTVIVPMLRTHGIDVVKEKYHLSDELCDLLQDSLTDPTILYDILVYLRKNPDELRNFKGNFTEEIEVNKNLTELSFIMIPDDVSKLESYKIVLDYIFDISNRVKKQLIVKTFLHSEKCLCYISTRLGKYSCSISKDDSKLSIPMYYRIHIENFENNSDLEHAYSMRKKSINLSDTNSLDESFLDSLETISDIFPDYVVISPSKKAKDAKSEVEMDELLGRQRRSRNTSIKSIESRKAEIEVGNITTIINSIVEQLKDSNSEISELKNIVENSMKTTTNNVHDDHVG